MNSNDAILMSRELKYITNYYKIPVITVDTYGDFYGKSLSGKQVYQAWIPDENGNSTIPLVDELIILFPKILDSSSIRYI